MAVDRNKLNPTVNEIVDSVLRVKDDIPVDMIVVMINFALAEMTASLRTKLELYDGTTKPLNNYSYVFAESGVGKDVTMSALNRVFIDAFKERMKKGFEKHKEKYWSERMMTLIDEDEEDAEEIIKEEKRMVAPFSYRISSGTLAGVSKSRVTYSLYNIGAVNLVIDELGSNYGMIRELVALMLSSYEDGSTEGRQLKSESVVAVSGVPSNFIGYSSPALAFDGGTTEKMLLADLSQGMARRSFFAYATRPKPKKMTAKERVLMIRNNADVNKDNLKELNEKFSKLASPKNMYQHVTVSEEAEIINMEYHMKCESLSESKHDLSEQERIELVNRAWKALRLAGVYAFINDEREITKEHIQQAIYVAEMSGEAFKKVMNQPKVFERMFQFIANRKETTEVDLENQKWYSGNMRNKRDLMGLAKAYGYKQDHLFRVKDVEGIDFYSFLPTPKTDPSKITISISKDIAKGYKSVEVDFDDLHSLVTKEGFMYSASTFKNGHRKDANAKKGQVLAIIDIDDSLRMETCKLMLSDYKCLISTTRNHQKEKNGVTADRYRVLLVLDRKLNLEPYDYAKFMHNLYEQLGVPADESCVNISRQYFSSKGEFWYSKGTKLIEVEPLIPESEKEVARRTKIEASSIGSTDGLERFLLEEAMVGSRNHTVTKYAFAMYSASYSYEDAEKKVFEFNEKMIEPLSKSEIQKTVLKSLQRKYNDTE